MRRSIKPLKLLTVLFITLLLSCNQTSDTDSQSNKNNIDSLKTSGNPDLSSTEPIHAVGGVLEEDPADLNHLISAHGGTLSPEQIMKMYYPHEVDPEAEGNETITISKEELEDGSIKIILIDDNMMDDAQKATKTELTLEPVGTAWKVLKIEKQWKCYEGRGHTDWGIQSCT
jgi:hypothetical protein